MNLKIDIPPQLAKFLDLLGGEGRRNLFSVAGENLHRLVQRHLSAVAPTRHFTAERLGGKRTGHIEKGISGSSFSADSDHAEVVIPVPGISRAFGPVEIRPRFAKALTIPVHGSAYGHRAAELSRMGWKMFSPKGKSVIMGFQDGKEAVPLYVLKKRVQLKEDRTLLPSDAEIRGTVARAMFGEIERITRKAS